MKKHIVSILIILLITSSGFSQEKVSTYLGYAEVGVQKGLTSKNNNITGCKISYNSIIKEKFLIGLNALYAFEPNFTKRASADHVNNYILPYINFGIRSKVAKNVYITPSIGIGQGNYVLTDYMEEEEVDVNFSFSGVAVDTKKKYSKIEDTQINVPINLNILYTTKHVGIGINMYLNAGKYTEMGLGLGICFGKLR